MAERRNTAFHRHMAREYRAYQRGRLHSGTRRTGPVVRQYDQYVAIGLSSARAKDLRGAPPAPKGS
jgi:hypothetical protein